MGEVLYYHEGKELATKYAEARPKYPQELIEKVMDFVWSHSMSPKDQKLGKMLDAGCGSGQASRPYAPYFTSVLGFDVSESQIEMGKKTTSEPNVSYLVGDGIHFPAEDGTVDFVNFGVSLHWMDVPNALSECQRVLKPGGCAALTAYYPAAVRTHQSPPFADPGKDDAEWMILFREWMVEGHMHPVNYNCIEGYRTIYKNINNPTKARIDDVYYERDYSLSEFRDFFSSLGGYHTFMQANRPKIDPLDVVMRKLKKFLKIEDEKDEEIRILVTYPFPTSMFAKI